MMYSLICSNMHLFKSQGEHRRKDGTTTTTMIVMMMMENYAGRSWQIDKQLKNL